MITIRRTEREDELAVSTLLCDCYRWLVDVERYTASLRKTRMIFSDSHSDSYSYSMGQ